jgi:hypothetical protein
MHMPQWVLMSRTVGAVDVGAGGNVMVVTGVVAAVKVGMDAMVTRADTAAIAGTIGLGAIAAEGDVDGRVHWDTTRMGRGMHTAQIALIICYQIELDKLNIYETLMCSIPKMC